MKYPIPDSQAIPQTEPSQLGVHAAAHADGLADPRLVIRGESTTYTPHTGTESQEDKFAFVDYLAFTLRDPEPFDQFPLRDVLIDVFNIPPHDWKLFNHGWNGYAFRVDLGGYGLVAFGGKSQRGTVHVQLSGKGCACVQDWVKVFTWGVSNNCKIRRVDLAHDDFLGEFVSIAKVNQWRIEGLFNVDGRPPKATGFDDFDSGAGKTIYIGSRKSGKALRVYEKGRQSGDPTSPWCRVELELRSKDRVIEWDVVLNPGKYLAGSYPAIAFLNSEQSRVATISKEKEVAYEKTLDHHRTACGKFINLLCHLENENHSAVIAKLRRPGIPKNLEHFFKEHFLPLGIVP